MYQNQADKFPEIYRDYQNIRSTVESKNNVTFEAMPVYGRINSLPDKLEKKDYIPATGIEARHVAHEVANGKNFFEEAGKSAITLGTGLGATGILGAIGAKHLGPTGSLLGISAGALTGALVSNAID